MDQTKRIFFHQQKCRAQKINLMMRFLGFVFRKILWVLNHTNQEKKKFFIESVSECIIGSEMKISQSIIRLISRNETFLFCMISNFGNYGVCTSQFSKQIKPSSCQCVFLTIYILFYFSFSGSQGQQELQILQQ